MITSKLTSKAQTTVPQPVRAALGRGWPGDVAVDDLAAAGLPVASVVRTAKIATIEAADAHVLGRLSGAPWAAVRHHLAATLGAA